MKSFQNGLRKSDPSLGEAGSESRMKRLLIIDDEPAFARLVERVAQGCGYAVTSTTRSEQFLDALVSENADVVVLDLSLPGTDGVELLRFMADSRCDAKVIIISGFDPRVLETSGRFGTARGLQIAATLTKPIGINQLRRAIMAADGSGPE